MNEVSLFSLSWFFESSSKSISIEPFAARPLSKSSASLSSKRSYYFAGYSDATESESESAEDLAIASKPKKKKRKKRKKKRKKKSKATANRKSAAAQFGDNASIERLANGWKKCLECGHSVKTGSGIRAHFARVHNPSLLKHECSVCRYANTSLVQVQKHEKDKHFGRDKPALCEYVVGSRKCNARFKTAAQWRKHCAAAHGFHMPDAKWHSYKQVKAFNDSGKYQLNAVKNH